MRSLRSLSVLAVIACALLGASPPAQAAPLPPSVPVSLGSAQDRHAADLFALRLLHGHAQGVSVAAVRYTLSVPANALHAPSVACACPDCRAALVPLATERQKPPGALLASRGMNNDNLTTEIAGYNERAYPSARSEHRAG